MKTKPLRIVTHEEFWAKDKEFARAHHARESHLSAEEQAANYDLFYDSLVGELSKIGTVAEGGLEDAEFSMSRYVDPNDVTCVVSDTATVFRTGALDAALRAITQTGKPHMIIFDTGSYIGVLPDGSIIGYSEREDLQLFEKTRRN